MTPKITIWNMALGFIGTRTIASEDENTLEAIQCKLYWDNARRGALRDYPWNFAQRRVYLAEVPMLAGYEEQYRYAYALPNDILKAHKIFPQGQDYEAMGDRERGRFIIAHNGESKTGILLCNAEKASLSYTADIEDASLFDDSFVYLLTRKLSAIIAVSLLKNNPQKVQELEQIYRMAIPSAVQANAGEGREKERPDSWILARG